jgi:tryptophan-associated transmembrane protein
MTADSRPTPLGPILAVAGGALLAIGSFLTWAEVSGGGQSESVTGTEGSDGWITLVAGVLVVAAGVAAFKAVRRPLAILIVAMGLVGGGVGLYDALTAKENVISEVAEQSAASTGASVAEVRAVLDQLIDSGQIGISIGIGLYVVIVGGVLAVVGGALQLSRTRSTASAVFGTESVSSTTTPTTPARDDYPPPTSTPAPTSRPPDAPPV